VSKEERHRIYEYAMDRKNREMEELKNRIRVLEDEQVIRESQIIIAEVVLFLLGMLIGAVAMHSFGGTT
jgi:hypothetical protein